MVLYALELPPTRIPQTPALTQPRAVAAHPPPTRRSTKLHRPPTRSHRKPEEPVETAMPPQPPPVTGPHNTADHPENCTHHKDEVNVDAPEHTASPHTPPPPTIETAPPPPPPDTLWDPRCLREALCGVPPAATLGRYRLRGRWTRENGEADVLAESSRQQHPNNKKRQLEEPAHVAQLREEVGLCPMRFDVSSVGSRDSVIPVGL